jgi:hypothetical protein
VDADYCGELPQARYCLVNRSGSRGSFDQTFCYNPNGARRALVKTRKLAAILAADVVGYSRFAWFRRGNFRVRLLSIDYSLLSSLLTQINAEAQ